MTKRLNITLGLLLAMTLLQGCAETVANEGTLNNKEDNKETTVIPETKRSDLAFVESYSFAPIGLSDAIVVTANGDLFVSEKAMARTLQTGAMQNDLTAIQQRVDAEEVGDSADEVTVASVGDEESAESESNQSEDTSVAVVTDKIDEKTEKQSEQPKTETSTKKAETSKTPAPTEQKTTEVAKKPTTEKAPEPEKTPAPKPVEKPKTETVEKEPVQEPVEEPEETTNFPYDPISQAELEAFKKEVSFMYQPARITITDRPTKEALDYDIKIFATSGMNDYYSDRANITWSYTLFMDYLSSAGYTFVGEPIGDTMFSIYVKVK